MSINVKGKTALVTGAALGIGYACTFALARAGAQVVLTDLDEKAGEEAAETLRQQGCEVVFHRLDVTSEAEWEAAVADTIERFDQFDILVNNAGIFDARFLLDTTLEDWQRIQSVNVDGVFLGVREAVRAMQPGGKAGKGGSIVNMSSAGGLHGSPGHAAYCASKGSVHLLTLTAASECAALGMNIRVNSVHPGVVETPMSNAAMEQWAGLFTGGDVSAVKQQIVGQHPLGKLGTPEDVANAVLYLASDASKFCTGTEIKVDGGYCL